MQHTAANQNQATCCTHYLRCKWSLSDYVFQLNFKLRPAGRGEGVVVKCIVKWYLLLAIVELPT